MNDFYPVGTILKLKNDVLQFVIVGYNNAYEGKKYDYVAVMAPVGIEPLLKSIKKNLFFFNHEDIEAVYSLGYIDEKVFHIIKQKEILKEAEKNRKKDE